MINSVLKALDILALFSYNEPRLSLAEISRRLDLPKSTAHGLLTTLVSRGLVERVDNEEYSLGVQLIVLAQAARVNVELRDRAAPLLRELADSCHESVYLAVLDDDHALYIYAIESPRRLLARSAVGERVLLHGTSIGKAILSCLAQDEVEAIVRRTGLPPFTSTTLTEASALYADLAQAKRLGYAIDREEHELNTFCMGAPIFDSRGRVLGACSISGNSPAILGSRQEELSQRVKYAAQEISRRMGYVPPAPSQVVEMPTFQRLIDSEA